jgi:predicted O-linked N-acetylglucosamine transferase (SPINDLY family)
LGDVSADFREHAVVVLPPPMLASHPADQYELYAYDFTKEENTAQRAAIKACFAHVRSIHALSDRQAAATDPGR